MRPRVAVLQDCTVLRVTPGLPSVGGSRHLTHRRECCPASQPCSEVSGLTEGPRLPRCLSEMYPFYFIGFPWSLRW